MCTLLPAYQQLEQNLKNKKYFQIDNVEHFVAMLSSKIWSPQHCQLSKGCQSFPSELVIHMWMHFENVGPVNIKIQGVQIHPRMLTI